MHELLNLLSNISDKWYELGVCLEVKSGELGSLQSSPKSNMFKLTTVLQKWKDRTSPPFTWATIMDVVSGPVINNRSTYLDIGQFLDKSELVNRVETYTLMNCFSLQKMRLVVLLIYLYLLHSLKTLSRLLH